jgi:hypothetical protein
VTDDELCKHELIPESCSICLHGVSKPERPVSDRPPFHALFEGWCAECKEAIEIGDLIQHTTADRYIHAECP